MDDRFRLNDEGPIFINAEGELFSVIIAVEIDERIQQIKEREADRGVEVLINGYWYIPHRADEVVLLNHLGIPTYLFYRSDMELKRILSIATNRIILHWEFDQLRGTVGTYHLRKSTLIPGHLGQDIPRC